MRIAGLVLSLALFALPAAAADIPAAEAAHHVGETVTVIGVLTNAHVTVKKRINLDIDGVYPNNTFSAVIFAHGSQPLPDFTPLVGKTLAITGKIKLYYGKPEIIIDSSDQVKVAH